MTKFYAMSGGRRLIILAENPRSAGEQLISQSCLKPLGEFLYVGERGFGDYEGLDPEGFLFLTEQIETGSWSD